VNLSNYFFLSISVIPGNLYVYLSLKTEVITRSTRYPLFIVFSIVCAVGLFFSAIIVWRSIIEQRRSQQQEQRQKVNLAVVGHTLKIALRLLKTKNMLLLLITFAYTGKSLRETKVILIQFLLVQKRTLESCLLGN
jgi:hypothetical protein